MLQYVVLGVSHGRLLQTCAVSGHETTKDSAAYVVINKGGCPHFP
jgi:hypothetical protein